MLQHRLRVAIECEACFGGRDAGIAAQQQQLVLEVGFQRGDVLTERGLGDAQRIGGTRHTAGINHRHEAFEFLEVDAHSTTVSLRANQAIGARLKAPPAGSAGRVPSKRRPVASQRI